MGGNDLLRQSQGKTARKMFLKNDMAQAEAVVSDTLRESFPEVLHDSLRHLRHHFTLSSFPSNPQEYLSCFIPKILVGYKKNDCYSRGSQTFTANDIMDILSFL